MDFDDDEQQALLNAARRAVEEGLKKRTWEPGPADRKGRLGRPGAAFVTLTLDGALRGCIGSLEPTRPLIVDVAHNARAAAYGDPRFEPLSAEDVAEVEFSISVLGPTTPMVVADEADLLAQLRPDVDGLVLRLGSRRATFLPSVWEDFPEPADFVAHLKQKAGLAPGFWSPELRFERYEVEEFS